MDYRPLFSEMSASGALDTNAILTSGQRYPPATGLQIFAIAIIFVFPAVALVVVMIRAAGRIAIRQFGWDDWLICIAMFLSIAETIISYFFIKTNFIGIHGADIPKNRNETEARIWLYAVQILYNPILALVKSSALIFLLRLFGQKDGVRRLVIALNVVNVMQMVAVFFAITLQCLPISFNWDLSVSNGRCVDRRILYTFTSSFNIATDLLVLGLPLWIFVDLKIPRRTKTALIFVFLLGFTVTITSVVRLVILVQGLFGLVTLSDPTYNIGFVVSAIETNLALITASAPALRPFFRARERGGWNGRSLIAPNKAGDVEANTSDKKPFGWPLSARLGSRSGSTPRSPGAKLSRGSSRGGRRGSSRRGRGGAKKYDIRLRRDNVGQELRSQSPRASEEEAMTANGIMRVSDIQREIDGIVKEIAVEGSGTYTGRPSTGRTASPTPSRRAGINVNSNRPSTAPRLLTNNLSSLNAAAAAAAAAANTNSSRSRPTTRDSHVNDFRNTGFDFFNRIPPPESSTTTKTVVRPVSRGRREAPTDRHYSESVYPDMEYYYTAQQRWVDEGERDFGEERMSKYGERRFGVVTPRSGVTPTTGNGWRESGRPF